jgi:Domain of unknown function DUF29
MHSAADARGALDDKLSPTLRRDIEANLEKLYADGRRQAALALRRFGEVQAAQALPTRCPFSLDEICEQEWYPASPDEQQNTEAK